MRDTKKEQKQNDVGIDKSRRRLTKAGVVGLPVAMTVLNRPAWGGQCSPSAVLSHTHASHHPDVMTCRFGCSPGYWGQCGHDWSKLTGYKYRKDMLFSDVFFPEEFGYEDKDKTCPFPNKTLYDVVVGYVRGCRKDSYTNHQWQAIRQCGFHAVAALLNAAAHPAMGYVGNYEDQVISDYRMAYDAFHNGGDSWCNGMEMQKNQWDLYEGDDKVVCMYDTHGDVSATEYWENVSGFKKSYY